MTTTVTRDTSRQIRPVPAGCGQQRWPERRSSIEACAVADAPRIEAPTDFGHIAECTDLGELPTDVQPRMPEPSAAFIVAIGVACIAVVAACALIAQHLPGITA